MTSDIDSKQGSPGGTKTSSTEGEGCSLAIRDLASIAKLAG
jgi:hypothetical protein